MYCIIYKFHVKENYTQEFLESWIELTKCIYTYEGSLGSRLHRESENEYIAYAQWPSKSHYLNAGNQLTTEAEAYKKSMKSACYSIETLHSAEMVVDLLK